MKTIGLDIGTTSIGWAIIDDNQKINAGVHIFPVGVKDDDYNKSGKEVSKNESRRTARGARRLNFRYKLRRNQLKRILVDQGMMPEFKVDGNVIHYAPFEPRELFYLRKKALDVPVTLQELGRIFLLINQRRGFKSGRKDSGKGDEKETSKLKISMGELDRTIESAGCRTLGEYYWSLFEKADQVENWRNPNEPIEPLHNKKHRADIGRYAFRSTYEKEFDLIWETQKQYHTQLTDELKIQIKDRTIFYQRKLKSAKHLVSKCRFYPGKKVSPKSHPVYQEFRTWQMLSDLRVTVQSDTTGAYRSMEKLTLEEKHLLAKELKWVDKLSEAQMKKLLGFSREAKFNQIESLGFGNRTLASFVKALGKSRAENMTFGEIDQLWHVLYCAEEDHELLKHLIEFYHFSMEEAEKLVRINLEPDYGKVSQKAAKGLVAHMKEGMDYSEASLALGFHHSQTELDNPNRELANRIKYLKKEDDLRNPLVNKTVSETIRIVNALISKYGRPDLVRVEFARSLQKPKKLREEELARNKAKKTRRDEYLEFLYAKVGRHIVKKSDLLKFELWLEMELAEMEMAKIAPEIDFQEFQKFALKVNSGDKLKYDLWLECSRISPYTGKVIRLSDLFSPEIEVEHIIPYSLCQDNSFINLTLAEKSFNANKGNRTPLQFFRDSNDQPGLLRFKKLVEHFSEAKQKRFLFEGSEEELKKFRPSDLANTAFISRVVRNKIRTAVKKVEVTNGQITSQLREFWGLNTMLNPDGENKKSRDDHRHHALDAITIAFTTNSIVHKLSQEAKFDHRGKMRIPDFPPPFPGFIEKTQESISSIFTSFRVESRLLVRKTNKYIHSKSKNKTPQQTITVRGALHEETYYGQIFHPLTKKPAYVTRKPLSFIKKLEDIEKIVDKPTRERIFNFLATEKAETDKSIQAALANGFFYKSKDGLKDIQVFKVRVETASSGMIQVRPDKVSNSFVESGSNYLFAIYEGEDGKRSFKNFSIFDSVKSLKANGTLASLVDEHGRKLLATFMKNEMFVAYKENEDEIDWENPHDLFSRLYRVVKFDKRGLIVSSIHNLGNVKVDYPKNYPQDVVLAKMANTWRGVKVRISETGDLIRI
jgi:CRISPR-associated endonuclease Csn1